jgi:hypothetical protein
MESGFPFEMSEDMPKKCNAQFQNFRVYLLDNYFL